MKNLFKAIAGFQRECPVIHKGTQGYGYSYADLPAILDVINPILGKHGLGFTQFIDGSKLGTIIFHESGEMIEKLADIPQDVALKGMNDFQVLGSAITYMRRYMLSAMLGIVTDKDVDAAGEQISKKPIAKNPNTGDSNSLPDDRFFKALSILKNDNTHADTIAALKKFNLNDSQKSALSKIGVKL